MKKLLLNHMIVFYAKQSYQSNYSVIWIFSVQKQSYGDNFKLYFLQEKNK